jgi:hypothetical protein
VNTGSYTGLLFLIMLIVPNLFWAKYPPKGYASDKENKILVFLERLGEICASCSLLIFSDLNPDREAGLWNLWLVFSGVIMLLYEYWWVRYFRSSKQLRDFYSSLLGIPVPGAVLPVAALLIMGIYGKVIWVVLSAAILGTGHIGIHLQHAKTLNSQ